MLKQPDAQRPTNEEMAWLRDLGTILAETRRGPLVVLDCPEELDSIAGFLDIRHRIMTEPLRRA